jgi:hypothetical protein
VSIATTKNTDVATIERFERRAMPQMPWPLVQPEPRRVPKPTRSPATTRTGRDAYIVTASALPVAST